jgi:ADP-ribose pyrophosphatase YjhB (NUDIX family)
MPQIVKLDTAIIAMVQTSAEQTLNHAAERLNYRIDFIGRQPPGHLLSVAARALYYGSRFQSEFPGCLRLDAAFAALQNLLVYEPLVPLAVPTRQLPAALFTDRHCDSSHVIPESPSLQLRSGKNATTPTSS